MFVIVAPTGKVIPAVRAVATDKVFDPPAPSILSNAVHVAAAAESAALNVSSPEVPVKESIPVVSGQIWIIWKYRGYMGLYKVPCATKQLFFPIS